MSRDDLVFLLERAFGIWLVVIGLDALPEWLDRWIGGGQHDKSVRLLALDVLVPVVAGAFLIGRRIRGGTTSGTAPSPSATHTTREDWLWVGCKLLGAGAMIHGVANLPLSAVWVWGGFPGAPRGTSIAVVLSAALWIAGGAWLFFGDGVWRTACRSRPVANVR